MPDISALEEDVAAAEPDRMAAIFFASPARKPHLVALYAFDLELSRVPYAVREAMAGHLRLAWWRDQLAALYAGKTGETPHAIALGGAIKDAALPRDLLDGMIDARDTELNECPFADEAAVKRFASATECAVMKLAARICGVTHGIETLANLAGEAQTWVRLTKSVARARGAGRCLIPATVLAAEGLTPANMLAGNNPDATRRAMQAMAKAAMKAIWSARQHPIPPVALAAILPAVLARQTIPLILKPDLDLHAPIPPVARLTAILALGRAAWLRRV